MLNNHLIDVLITMGRGAFFLIPVEKEDVHWIKNPRIELFYLRDEGKVQMVVSLHIVL
jgi:hypothetical protein